MTTIDIPRLRKEVEWVEEQAAREDGKWYQQQWTTIKRAVVDTLRRQGKVKTIPALSRPEMINMGIAYDLEALQARCGTAYCLAGHISHQEGDIPLIYSAKLGGDGYNQSNLGGTVHSSLVLTPEDKVMTVSDRAAQVLGIDNPAHASMLFNPNNTAERIREIAEEIAGERL